MSNNGIDELKKKEIFDLSQQMRKVAGPVGPLHGWWDIISDLEALAEGRKTLITKTPQEWVDYAKGLLAEHHSRQE